VAVFVGRFEHTLDDKGRLVLPTTYRSRLMDGGFLTPYQNCLALWAPNDFEGFVERLRDKTRNQEAATNAMRTLLANAADVKPDGQGRIAVPARLRDYADLDGGVVLTGALDHIELWNADRWNEVNAEGEASLADAVKNLGIF
jgi:transcriptional regulator MraZ